MYYEARSSTAEQPNSALVVDLRSDTLTKPTKEMRIAMLEAEVGDDVYQEDPTVKKLEKEAANLLGMEDALFVSSGTMGNLIAIMNHCDERGSEAYCGEESHTLLHEQCGASQIAGVSLCVLENRPDGTFDIEKLRTKIRRDRDHEPISKLVLVENTLNGKIVPRSWIRELVAFCRENNLKVHMDGARLWNASVGSNELPAKIVEGFDSVTFCLSKALGAPVGSVLCGRREFISKARRVRKVLGGGMRQVGILAAAGIVALRKTVPILHVDHQHARKLAEAINGIGTKTFSVDLKSVQTNMVFMEIQSENFSASDFAKRLREIRKNEEEVIVKCLAITDSAVRFVFYYDITEEMVNAAIRKVTDTIKEFDQFSLS